MPPRRVARAKQPDKHISDDVKAVEDDKHEELPADEAGFAGLTPSPNKNIDDEDDLNYDEYDLAEECDISIDCKVCRCIFSSLEKFISHKKTECKERRSAGKASKAKELPADLSIAVGGSKDVSIESPRRSGRKRKVKDLDSLDLPITETTTESPKLSISNQQVVKVYGGKKRREKKILEQPLTTVPSSMDEVQFIDTSILAEEEMLTVNDQEEYSKPEPESDDEDINQVVLLSMSQGKKPEEDVDIPVRLTSKVSLLKPPNSHSEDTVSTPDKPQTYLPVPGRGLQQVDVTAYALIKVDDSISAVTPRMSLGHTLAELRKVRFMKLMQPLAGPEAENVGETTAHLQKLTEGFLKGEIQKGCLPEELPHKTCGPEATDALGALQKVVAMTKDRFVVALYLRKVVKCHVKESGKSQPSGESSIPPQPAGETPVITDLEKSSGVKSENATAGNSSTIPIRMPDTKKEQVEDGDDVLSDDEDFEHDPSLYDVLRDDSIYILKPKQRTRLSRMDIKSRTDCDWKNLQCLTCDTTYSCIKTLINHMSYQHSDKKAFYPCIFCCNVYSQHKNVARHIMKTHNKAKIFVDRLRGFIRCQAFTRTFIDPNVDMDLLTDDTDPFMCKVREMRGHQVTTRYCSMSDKDIMAKYGRKVKVIGRPPGRPSKSSQQTVCFTCTMCESQMATAKLMLHHLRNEHNFTQKQVNRWRGKLLNKVEQFIATERQKQKDEEVCQPPKRLLPPIVVSKSGSPVKPGYVVDRYGRLIQQQKEKFVPTPVTQRPPQQQQQQQRERLSDGTTVLKLLKCAGCQAVFSSHSALDSHSCLPTPKPLASVVVRTEAVQQSLQMDANEISGLETLAEISTKEASKNGATRSELAPNPMTVEKQADKVVQLSFQTPQRVPARQQVLTITPEQLEQIRKSGNNVIYLVNQ